MKNGAYPCAGIASSTPRPFLDYLMSHTKYLLNIDQRVLKDSEILERSKCGYFHFTNFYSSKSNKALGLLKTMAFSDDPRSTKKLS